MIAQKFFFLFLFTSFAIELTRVENFHPYIYFLATLELTEC